MLNKKVIKHIRKALVSWNNTYPLLKNLQGGKIKCPLSQNTANCFLSFEIIWAQEQTSPGFFWAIPWAKSTSQCIQSYCAREQEQRGPSRRLPEVKFRLWFETGAFTCQEQFPLLFIRLAARKALEVQIKKTCLTLSCKGCSNSAGLQSFHLMMGRPQMQDDAKICSRSL